MTTDGSAAKTVGGSKQRAARTHGHSETEHGSVAKGMVGDPILPLKIYGPELSYFTGKLEAVIRFKELPYQRIAKAPMGEVARATGVAQVPGLQLADERSEGSDESGDTAEDLDQMTAWQYGRSVGTTDALDQPNLATQCLIGRRAIRIGTVETEP